LLYALLRSVILLFTDIFLQTCCCLYPHVAAVHAVLTQPKWHTLAGDENLGM
jgi:hypothetical protein